MSSKPLTGRILGLDAGERRIGVAISDPDARFALPLRSIDTRDGDSIEQIEALIAAENIVAIVVGLPISLSGEHTAQTDVTEAFARDLEARLNLPVHLQDERLSTREAEHLTESRSRGFPASASSRHKRRTGRSDEADTDALAASIILQSFLETRRIASERPL